MVKMGPWEMIAAERVRQQTKEGYSPEHDAEHGAGELARFAAAYALSSHGSYPDAYKVMARLGDWEFKPEGGTKEGQVKDLVRAGALILAELERVMRRDGLWP
jgi:hypothetical protein